MANRLQKRAVISYTPAVQAQPAVPGYCVSRPVYYPAMTIVLSYKVVTEVRDDVSYTRYVPIYQHVPARTEYVTTCYPATPAVQAVPESTQYLAINGWNSGASSIAALEKDGHFEFRVSGSPRGVVIGLSTGNSSTLPSEPSHAFYFHGTQVDLMQYGEVVAHNVLTHSASTVYRIARRDSRVTFEADGWSYAAGLPSDGAVLLDVSLYTSGDYVDDPALIEYGPSGSAYGSLPALVGVASGNSGYSIAAGSLPALVGEAYGRAMVTAYGELPSLTGLASDRPYAAASGELPALTGEAVGGYPTFAIAGGYGALSPLVGTGHGLTGEIASGDGSLAAFTGYGADRPYAFGEGSLPAFTGLGNEGGPITTAGITSPLAIGAIFHPADIAVDGFASPLTIGGTFELILLAQDGYVSTLLLGGLFGGLFAASDSYQSGLLLGSLFGSAEQSDGVLGALEGQPMQLAVNLATGAPTLYLDFAFSDYARCGDRLYACRDDGLYLIGAGDDEGLPLQGLVDFGASEFGASQIKRAESVYFGLKTDAIPVLQVETDSGSYEYPVALRGPMGRAVTGKGCYGRTWNLALEFSDATYFELDALEVQIGATQRRLRGR